MHTQTQTDPLTRLEYRRPEYVKTIDPELDYMEWPRDKDPTAAIEQAVGRTDIGRRLIDLVHRGEARWHRVGGSCITGRLGDEYVSGGQIGIELIVQRLTLTVAERNVVMQALRDRVAQVDDEHAWAAIAKIAGHSIECVKSIMSNEVKS